MLTFLSYSPQYIHTAKTVYSELTFTSCTCETVLTSLDVLVRHSNDIFHTQDAHTVTLRLMSTSPWIPPCVLAQPLAMSVCWLPGFREVIPYSFARENSKKKSSSDNQGDSAEGHLLLYPCVAQQLHSQSTPTTCKRSAKRMTASSPQWGSWTSLSDDWYASIKLSFVTPSKI